MESRVKNENYIMIQGWMINELKLKGNDLMVYAVIYGFSQAEGQCYNGSLQYLADWCGSSKQGVMKNLKSLIDKGLITKEEIFKNNVKFCEYRTTISNTVHSQKPNDHQSGERNYSGNYLNSFYIN